MIKRNVKTDLLLITHHRKGNVLSFDSLVPGWMEQQARSIKHGHHRIEVFVYVILHTHTMVSASHSLPRQMNMYTICGP